jgi:hypothetical protein
MTTKGTARRAAAHGLPRFRSRKYRGGLEVTTEKECSLFNKKIDSLTEAEDVN